MAEEAVNILDVEEEQQIPEKLPVLPLRHGVLFPELTVPLMVSRPEHIKLVDEALVKDRALVAVAQRDEKAEKPDLMDLYRMGVAVFILKMMRSRATAADARPSCRWDPRSCSFRLRPRQSEYGRTAAGAPGRSAAPGVRHAGCRRLHRSRYRPSRVRRKVFQERFPYCRIPALAISIRQTHLAPFLVSPFFTRKHTGFGS